MKNNALLVDKASHGHFYFFDMIKQPSGGRGKEERGEEREDRGEKGERGKGRRDTIEKKKYIIDIMRDR